MGFLRNLASVLTFGIIDDTHRAEKRKENQKEEQRRVNTPVLFEPPITKEKFNELAIEAGKHIKRLWIETKGHYVIGTVKSSSGISEWYFKFDYNDYGKITGKRWIERLDNRDSNIPDSFDEKFKSLITQEIEKNVCPNCHSHLEEQKSFNTKTKYHRCTKCRLIICDADVYSGEKFPGIYWFCDECDDLINDQSGFSDKCGTWKCQKCGHINSIDSDNFEHHMTLKFRTMRLSITVHIPEDNKYDEIRCEIIKNATWKQIEAKIDEVFKHYDELHYGGRLKWNNAKAGDRIVIDDLVVELHPDFEENPSLEYAPYGGFSYTTRNLKNIIVNHENLESITSQYVKDIFKKFFDSMEPPNDSWWSK